MLAFLPLACLTWCCETRGREEAARLGILTEGGKWKEELDSYKEEVTRLKQIWEKGDKELSNLLQRTGVTSTPNPKEVSSGRGSAGPAERREAAVAAGREGGAKEGDLAGSPQQRQTQFSARKGGEEEARRSLAEAFTGVNSPRSPRPPRQDDDPRREAARGDSPRSPRTPRSQPPKQTTNNRIEAQPHVQVPRVALERVRATDDRPERSSEKRRLGWRLDGDAERDSAAGSRQHGSFFREVSLHASSLQVPRVCLASPCEV